MALLNEAQEEQLKEITTHLRQVRQEKSIAIEEIAAQTLIRLAFLQALEEWRFEELPEMVYVQGFIRRYAEALGLDGTTLANRLTVDDLGESHNKNRNIFDVKPSIQIPLFLTYILLLVAASAGLLYILNPKIINEKLGQRQKPTPTLESPALSSPLSLSSRKIDPVKVTLELQDESWLRVKADGKTEFEGTLTKGQRKSWTAQKQLTVRSDNASAVLVSVNQQEPKPLGNPGQVAEVTYTP